MPGWHDATEALQRAGKVQMLGIIQEQNPDRCRLFMQWQQMDWPILVDTFDLLEVSVVPLTYAIDEHGIVRLAGLRLGDAETLEARFLDKTWPAPAASDAPSAVDPKATGVRELRALAAQATSGATDDIAPALDAYAHLVRHQPENGWAHFRLAAAYRLRYDSAGRKPEDFQRAVDHWQRALEIDPNNYIWRRRIQQYGPRLTKPYPFYDWIPTAREAILARGETPSPLTAEPTGAEIASPSRTFDATAATIDSPDPDGRVYRDRAEGDTQALIHTEITTVPHIVAPGAATRAHLVFRPNGARLAHWNNETEPLRVWIDPPQGWHLDHQLLTTPNDDQPTSNETRSLELEIKVPKGAAVGPTEVPAYALYYVCEDENGTCLYRRQDLKIRVDVRGP